MLILCNNKGKLHLGPMPQSLPLAVLSLLTALGIVAMGADNSHRLARCEASGRSAAECRLLVLGR